MKNFVTYPVLIRVGLGLIFIANSLTAYFAPTEFIDLVSNSFIAPWLPLSPEHFVSWVIVLNDGLVGLLLLLGYATRRVAVWAMLWLIGVMIVIAEPFDIIEHLGMWSMAVALVFARNEG